MSERNESSSSDNAILSFLLDKVKSDQGAIAIHSGHFMILPNSPVPTPTVATQPQVESPPSASHCNPIKDALNRFSLRTWRLGAALAAALRSDGRDASLLILTNDWQYLRGQAVTNAKDLRRAFYQANKTLFPSYQAILREHDLSDDVVMSVSGWQPFVSEYWLRRRIERRLKRLAKNGGAIAKRLNVETASDGTRRLVYDDLGRACRLLMCGQSDCAGECTELICLLHEQGVRILVNIIPSECEIPVAEGSRRAISLFGLSDLIAINVSLPCLAAAGDPDGGSGVRLTRVTGAVVDDGEVDATAEPIHLTG